jgi:hypothetical protein
MLKPPPSPSMLNSYLCELRLMGTTMHHHQCCIFICVNSGSWAPPYITTNVEAATITTNAAFLFA